MIKQITITQPADLMPLKEAAFFELFPWLKSLIVGIKIDFENKA